MKALLRNLIATAALMTFAGQAYAAGPARVIWTFSGFSFDNAQYSTTGSTFSYVPPLGGLQDGSTMSFDAEGNLVDFHIVTDGAFGHTYTPLFTHVDDPSPYSSVGIGFSSGSFYLQISFLPGLEPGQVVPPGFGPLANSVLPVSNSGTWENDNALATPSDPTGVIRFTSSAGTISAQYVPEPASMALLGTALLAMGAVIRRRNNKLS